MPSSLPSSYPLQDASLPVSDNPEPSCRSPNFLSTAVQLDDISVSDNLPKSPLTTNSTDVPILHSQSPCAPIHSSTSSSHSIVTRSQTNSLNLECFKLEKILLIPMPKEILIGKRQCMTSIWH
ncbi:hypothetical protein LIER_38399 [Lithospermum erythrorhizon]|uniref:Uncharacterized protein n=1 Tax=Lithospermum erythrorhizon TaxID=34254 RepID=A0AAV3Q120_LITER